MRVNRVNSRPRKMTYPNYKWETPEKQREYEQGKWAEYIKACKDYNQGSWELLHILLGSIGCFSLGIYLNHWFEHGAPDWIFFAYWAFYAAGGLLAVALMLGLMCFSVGWSGTTDRENPRPRVYKPNDQPQPLNYKRFWVLLAVAVLPGMSTFEWYRPELKLSTIGLHRLVGTSYQINIPNWPELGKELEDEGARPTKTGDLPDLLITEEHGRLVYYYRGQRRLRLNEYDDQREYKIGLLLSEISSSK